MELGILETINKKLDLILNLVTPKLSELQDKEVVAELFKPEKEFDYNLNDIQPSEDFNETTDIIINNNKLI